MDSGFKILQDSTRLLVLPGAGRAAFCGALPQSNSLGSVADPRFFKILQDWENWAYLATRTRESF